TSYAAPHVTGVAALLEEGTENTAGLTLGGTGNHNHLGIKAVILNSARKRFINEPENEYPFAEDHGTTDMQASDGNYLTAEGKLIAGNTAGADKTEQWT